MARRARSLKRRVHRFLAACWVRPARSATPSTVEVKNFEHAQAAVYTPTKILQKAGTLWARWRTSRDLIRFRQPFLPQVGQGCR